MKKFIGTTAATAAAVLVASGLAFANGQTKTDVCHAHGDGTFDLITVADPAIDSHIAHGDGLIGDPVPGQPGFVFDEACVAIPAPVADPYLRALAWQDVNNNRAYDEGVDRLVAQLRNENDVTEITTGSTLEGKSDLAGGEGVLPFQYTEHVGGTITVLADGFRVDRGTEVHIWQANETEERYFEEDTAVTQEVLGPVTELKDIFADDKAPYDILTFGVRSPSAPVYYDPDFDSGTSYEFSFGDEPFVQVSIYPQS
jgi:hypothetical protein